MKAIIYSRPDGGVSICRPIEGARLALSVTQADGTVIRSETPRPVDTFARRWPVAGATAEWAETEEEFIERIRQKDVDKNATNVLVVDEAAIPADRAHRRAWRLNAGVIAVDDTVVQQLKNEDAVKAIDGIDRLQFEHLFRLENRTRLLEGKLAITRAQYRDALISEWKTLNQ